jgi:hypothetical protein
MYLDVLQYKLRNDWELTGLKKGDIVYDARYDFGMANWDSECSGVKHISVTVRPGDDGFITVPMPLLECLNPPPPQIEVPPCLKDRIEMKIRRFCYYKFGILGHW